MLAVKVAFVGLTSWDPSLIYREAVLLTLSNILNSGVGWVETEVRNRKK
jgi:hypothetical protein